MRTLALALLFCGAGLGLAQQPAKKVRVEEEESPRAKQKTPPAKSKLEEMLAEALKNNPDIRVAAAKLAEADAELNRTRVQVMQKVVTLYHAIETQKKVVEHAERRAKRGQAAGAGISHDDLEALSQELALAKAKLEELEAQLPALLGKTASAEAHSRAGEVIVRRALDALALERSDEELRREVLHRTNEYYRFLASAQRIRQNNATGPMSERLRKALQTPVKVDYKDKTITSVLKDLEKKVSGLSFHIRDVPQVAGDNYVGEEKLTLHFDDPLPIASILQAIKDTSGSAFYVRDYGILVTSVAKPNGALTVEEFLRQKPAEQPRHQPSSGKNPPAENVEGLVKSVDAKGLLTLTIGSDAGLAKGHTLELFRLNPSSPKESKYLGTIRILEAEAHQSVAQAVGRLADTPKAGDRVASRILGK